MLTYYCSVQKCRTKMRAVLLEGIPVHTWDFMTPDGCEVTAHPPGQDNT